MYVPRGEEATGLRSWTMKPTECESIWAIQEKEHRLPDSNAERTHKLEVIFVFASPRLAPCQWYCQCWMSAPPHCCHHLHHPQLHSYHRPPEYLEHSSTLHVEQLVLHQQKNRIIITDCDRYNLPKGWQTIISPYALLCVYKRLIYVCKFSQGFCIVVINYKTC